MKNTTNATATTAARFAPAKPAKLRDGNWGARVGPTVERGETVEVRTAAGKTWLAQVVEIVATTATGEKVVRTFSLDRAPRATASSSRRTGCACGSREDGFGAILPNSRNCSRCEQDA